MNHAVEHRLDVKIGYHCNNRCLFCAQGGKRKHIGQRSGVEIIREVISSRDTCSSLVLTGGEPTIHPDFLRIVRKAKKAGYGKIQVQSNGRMFCYEAFCRRCIEAGVDDFALSLHGPTAAVHDRLTRAAGSFKQTLQGIKNLVALGQVVNTNTVITRVNFRHLPRIAELLVSLGVNQFQFAYLHIIGVAAEQGKDFIVKKSVASSFLRKALKIGRSAGKKVFTEAVPYCFLFGYEDCIAEQNIPETMVIDNDERIDDYTSYRVGVGKAKGPLCRRCAHFVRCEGPWREYPRIFGWSEFKPVKNG